MRSMVGIALIFCLGEFRAPSIQDMASHPVPDSVAQVLENEVCIVGGDIVLGFEPGDARWIGEEWRDEYLSTSSIHVAWNAPLDRWRIELSNGKGERVRTIVRDGDVVQTSGTIWAWDFFERPYVIPAEGSLVEELWSYRIVHDYLYPVTGGSLSGMEDVRSAIELYSKMHDDREEPVEHSANRALVLRRSAFDGFPNVDYDRLVIATSPPVRLLEQRGDGNEQPKVDQETGRSGRVPWLTWADWLEMSGDAWVAGECERKAYDDGHTIWQVRLDASKSAVNQAVSPELFEIDSSLPVVEEAESPGFWQNLGSYIREKVPW